MSVNLKLYPFALDWLVVISKLSLFRYLKYSVNLLVYVYSEWALMCCVGDLAKKKCEFANGAESDDKQFRHIYNLHLNFL